MSKYERSYIDIKVTILIQIKSKDVMYGLIWRGARSMKTFILSIFAIASFSLFAFPDEITFKNKIETFTHKHMLVIKDGRIWIKDRRNSSPWKLLNGNGLPTLKGFESPTDVVSINADGNNLIALDADNYLYLMKFDFMKHDSWKWKFEIGLPFKDKMKIPETARAWAVSHRGDVSKYYEDIDGNKFKVTIGVSTIYVLQENGTKISYVDPWIPPNLNHKFSTPLKGRFVATNLSASSSTVFIINDSGEMYTRLYDYDNAGENPVFSYTYRPRKIKTTDSGCIFRPRKLPAELWKEQPKIDGLITKQIAIVQNGIGNAGRELRVEGINDNGQSGYFYKQIFDNEWKFQIDDHEITHSLLDTNISTPLAEQINRDYKGQMRRANRKMDIELLDFHHHTNAGIFQFRANGTVYSAPIYVRRLKYKKSGKIKMKATIILPDSFMKDKSREAKKIKRYFFGKKTQYVSLQLTIDGQNIKARSSATAKSRSRTHGEEFERSPLTLNLAE